MLPTLPLYSFGRKSKQTNILQIHIFSHLDLEKLEGHLDAKRQKQQEARDPLLRSLQELVDSFHSTADILTNSVEKNLGALMKKELHDHNDK